MENTLTLYDLEKSLRETLDDNASEILSSAYPDDELYEYADSEVPIYNSDLLDVCASELWLGADEPEIEAQTAFDCLRNNIYFYLIEKAHEWLNERQPN